MNEKILKNPISKIFKQSLDGCSKRIIIAVPFLSSFMKKIVNGSNINQITQKKIITRFDQENLNSFDLPTLKYLLDRGFNIRSNEKIHLKLYILDDDVFVTSSNFTSGGFEKNIELTVKIDKNNVVDCVNIFDEIWQDSKLLTREKLNENWDKYEFLKKKEKHKTEEPIFSSPLKTKSELDIQLIIDEVFKREKDYSKFSFESYEANKRREKMKTSLVENFDSELFYVPEGHPKRRDSLFYDLQYGHESYLASTGLREDQFRLVFQHPKFKEAISFIYPEIIRMKPWNLSDKKEYFEFCRGIFDFEIPHYVEALPIRLASYFYPDFFIPIFKLEHLSKISDSFGLNSIVTSRGARLFEYNNNILEYMKSLPKYDNYIKSNIAYSVMYTIELHSRLRKGEDYGHIKSSYREVWKREFIENGMNILKDLNFLK